MATDNIAVVRKNVEQAWNKGNFDVLGETISPSLVAHDPVFGEYRGPAGEMKHITMLRTAFPDLNLRIDDIGAAGDRVFMRWTATGTHRGALLNLPATQRRSTVAGITLMRVEGGKICETWQSWDTHGLLTSLGVAQPLEQLARAAGSQPGIARP